LIGEENKMVKKKFVPKVNMKEEMLA